MTRNLPVILLFFITRLNVFGQTSDIVKSDSILYDIHRQNTGRIAFMRNAVPIESFTQADFLTEFELIENTDFNIRVFLANSLTNYLHLLSPELSATELTANGNYRFSFIVDNKLIYVEDLNTGAGSVENKNQRTVLRVPFLSTANEDSWGRFLWNRFMMNGGQDALAGGEHLLRIEIRPYLKLNETIAGDIIADGQIRIIVPEVKVDNALVSVQPIADLNDWQISDYNYDISLIEELNRKIADKTFKDITSIVVIREGKLLIEEYFNGAGRNTLHDTRSVGKSFASAIMGLAISDGHLKNEFQTLSEFYDLKKYKNYSFAKENITLKDLLTMSSPFDGSDMKPESPGNEENMYPSGDWVEFTLNLPVDNSKLSGKKWDYFTAGVIVLGDVIHRSVPDGLEKYANTKLFKPLDIEEYKWQYTPKGVANTAGGLQLRSLDYAKFGQLYKNGGVWNNKQILTNDWIEKSLSRQMAVADDEYYGFLFWNKTYKSDEAQFEAYYSTGNGGNRIIIFREIPLVIVITSTAFNKPYAHSQTDKIVLNYLLPAIVE
jgi:CubicO group peptidase (beta-lactamase class C family)